jgi:hypothetical protein
VQKRAALGKFFGAFCRIIARPFMVRKNEKWKKIKMRPWRQNRGKWTTGCAKIGVSCFRKKGFRVLGGCNAPDGCPKIGVSYFRKKDFRIFGTCCKMWHVHFSAFLIF